MENNKTVRVVFSNGLILYPAFDFLSFDPGLKFVPAIDGANFQAGSVDVPANVSISDRKKTRQELLVAQRTEMVNSDTPINMLALVPNLKCQGKCTYCYAAETRDQPEEYLTPEQLDKSIEELGCRDTLKYSVIFGGEPALNIAKLSELLITLPKHTSIIVVTGLLYEDENFEGLKTLLNQFENLAITVSIDPFCEPYSRRYADMSDKDLYEFLLTRTAELLSKYGPKRVGLRATMTRKSSEFKSLILDLRTKGADKISITIEPDSGTEFTFEELQQAQTDLFWFNAQNPYLAGPASRFKYDPLDTPDRLFNSQGDCNQGFGGATVGADGLYYGCPDTYTHAKNKFLLSESKDEINKLRTGFWSKCENCDFTSMCGGLCYIMEPTKTMCIWRVVNLLEALYYSFKDMSDEQILTAVNLQNALFSPLEL